MDDPSKFVGTIYDLKYAQKVSWMRENFKGGRALFTQPPPPLKCGGAPQKIMYLCDDYWQKKNISTDIHFFTPLPQMFTVKYYSDALELIVKEKNLNPHYTSVMTSVRDGVATFKNTIDNSFFEEKFDFLHAVPLLTTPQFLKKSKISNESGFVTVDPSMRHAKYSNIWGIGDCVDLPNSKTAAAVFSQAPVLVHNLETSIKQNNMKKALYDGYSACPIYTSKGSLLLAEFREFNDEKGNLVRIKDESFHPGHQNKPCRLYYEIALMFSYIYPFALKGYWFGKNSFFRPNFEKVSLFNPRNLYKYYYVPGFIILSLLAYYSL